MTRTLAQRVQCGSRSVRSFEVSLDNKPSNLTWDGISMTDLRDMLLMVLQILELGKGHIFGHNPANGDQTSVSIPLVGPKSAIRFEVERPNHFRHPQVFPTVFDTCPHFSGFIDL